MLKRRSYRDLSPLPVSDETETGRENDSASLTTALHKAVEQKPELEQEHIVQLKDAVIQKLCTAIVEKGMVSLFHNIETGLLDTELYSAVFSSPNIPNLDVMVFRDHKERLNNISQLSLTMTEHEAYPQPYRSLSIERTRDMPEGEFNLRFSVSGRSEGRLTGGDKVEVIPYSEKVQLLEDVLATEVDETQTAARFGEPYRPGGIRPHSFHPPRYGEDFEYSGYWVRDIVNQLPALPGGIPELTDSSTPKIS